MRWIRILHTVCMSFTVIASFAQNDSNSVVISATQGYQPTSIHVKRGETYRFSAEGQWQDASFPATDANGFKGFTAPMFFGMLLKPLPGQYYMKLCGKVGNWKFPIGTSTTITMKRSGELELFANDAKGFFHNNSGQMVVTLTLVSERDD